MRKILFFLFSLCMGCFLFAEETAQIKAKEDTKEVASLSKALGHLIAQQLKENTIQVDMNLVTQGMQDEEQGKDKSMTKEKCIEILASYQEKMFEEMSKKNLKEAETFLTENGKKNETIKLEKGKLQYSIVKPGDGVCVEEFHSPLLKYKGTFLDGQVFDEVQEPMVLALNETLPGFSRAIVGMKEGEVRKIFIHPDLGYGTDGTLPPNSLLAFEVEIIKANNPPEKECCQNQKEIADKENATR